MGEALTEGLYQATYLIERILDLQQSEREARFVVKEGVDEDLDTSECPTPWGRGGGALWWLVH